MGIVQKRTKNRTLWYELFAGVRGGEIIITFDITFDMESAR